MVDFLFLPSYHSLCSMARDMSMKVRVEAFDALGKIEIVSEEFLLQSLSKRIIGLAKQKEFLDQIPSEQFPMLATSIAGALVHGLEDEFFEVRKSACQSLQTLTILSAEFAQEALNLLMDVLNDDSMVVRLEALETMHCMAISGRLKVQEKHLHMFLGALVDNSLEVRCTARKILKVVKLNDLVLFKSSVDGILKILDIYPQDEADVFSAVSHMGRNHEKFVIFIINKVFQEIEAAFEGKLEFNSARVAALLILSISASLSLANVDRIPPVMFSYAATFLGRISFAFNDVMDRDTLLAYLSEKSRSAVYPRTSIMHEEGKQQSPSLSSDPPYNASNEMISSVRTLSQEKDIKSEIQSHIMLQPKVASSHVQQELVVYNEVIPLINHFLAEAPNMWPLIQSGCTNQILKILRHWKEELATTTFDSLGSGDAVAFTLQYVRIIKLLAELWQHFLPAKRFCSRGMGELDLKLAKLARSVKELRSRFIGFSPEEELNVLELILVTLALRLCKVEICCHILTFRRLAAVLSYAESLLKQGSTEPSMFVVELRKLLQESGTSMNGASLSPVLFDRCLKFFSPKLFVFRGNIRPLKAELRIPDNNMEHPLSFVSGLPVATPCEIKLYNISTENRLWLSMSMDDGSTQHAFLDLTLFEGVGDIKRYAFAAPFYRTPKANSFTLRVSIGLECLFDYVSPVQNQMYGGPKHELTFLCEEQVYLSKVNN
ncbi:hypothetical protein L6164_000129 [Bauhinia variegata]|uniref:Uncharacterized protein n=1 Tax=Bauhinia variegata TaxID=167791 RepID=A0ACB9Q720_BAUVA|nr:hypothetical protein L6164_000129 [Bauhinia variegata]